MKTVKVLVLEPGKGNAVNSTRELINTFLSLPWHYQFKVVRHIFADEISTTEKPQHEIVKEFFKSYKRDYGNDMSVLQNTLEGCQFLDNPERPAIDHNGHDLQPREQPYECKEVWQWAYKHLEKIVWREQVYQYTTFEDFAHANFALHTRIAYQSIEDAVKGEKAHPMYQEQYDSLQELKSICDKKIAEYEAKHSTLVNEAKEVEKLWKDVYSAIAHALGYPGNNSDVKDITLATNNVMDVISAPHPIENKEGVKTPATIVAETFEDNWISNYPKVEKLIIQCIEAYHAQFTPIEQGKRMVSVDRLIELMNHQIAWANAEIQALPKHNDGTEEAYFKGHILGVSYCKKLLKENQKYK